MRTADGHICKTKQNILVRHACYEHDVRLSLCLSMKLMDCDHIYSATKSGNRHISG